MCDTSDTVNGFSFHPFLTMAASSSGHRRFVVPGDGEEDLYLGGNFIILTSFFSSSLGSFVHDVIFVSSLLEESKFILLNGHVLI